MIGVYYGSFRHWGHPFIDYKLGLEKLHNQVYKDKTVDSSYVKALASNLAKKVLESEFKKQRKWFVNGSKLQ
jgi:Mononegavirales RNA dependent RNA polymerase